MIISHQHKTIFMHIPKCAGTSVREMLVRADPEADRMWGWRWMPRQQRYCDSAHLPFVDLPPAVLRLVRGYFVIALVRDPMDRFRSAYAQHFSQHRYRKKKSPSAFLAELDSIKIRYDPAYVHFCPQHYFTHIGNEQIAKLILHMENDDWPQQLRDQLVTLGFPPDKLALPRRNHRETTPVPDFSADERARFYRLYGRDYHLFGYDFAGAARSVLDAMPQTDADRPYDFCAYDEVHFMDATFKKH